jgi:sulfur carrier protein ThiS
MKVKVRLLPGKRRAKTLELGARATVEDAIRSLGLFPDAWIAIREETPVPLDERLRDGDNLKLISAVSGG